MQALLRAGGNLLEPRILALACENDAYPALDMAAQQGFTYSAFARIIPVRCLGSVNTIWITDALNSGYDGAILMGCQKGENYQCHFVKGSELAHVRMSKIDDTLKQLALEPERVARLLVDKGFTPQYDYAVQSIKEIPYGKWRDYDAEDTVRFYSLRLQEAGMIKSSPQKIISQGADWRFLDELKQGRIVARKCSKCSRTLVPPRMYCEQCFRPTDEWTYVKDTGRVNTYSISHVAADASRLKEPLLVAVVELDGASPGMGILHTLNEVEASRVQVGLRVQAVWKPAGEREGAITDIRYFKPMEAV